MLRSRDENIPTERHIPVESLLILSGTMNGFKNTVIKDNECDTNVVKK